MTLRTATYDDSTHKIVPIKSTTEWELKFSDLEDIDNSDTIKNVIEAAPEYQDKTVDLESRDFYEVMQAYRTAILDAAPQFEAVKQWLRTPTYEYQEPTKDEQC